jgi:hypothetical protein
MELRDLKTRPVRERRPSRNPDDYGDETIN